MSLSDFTASEFSCLFEGDSLELVSNGFESGSISIPSVSVDECFKMMAHLPHTSRLSWESIPHLGIGVSSDAAGVAMDCKLEFLGSVGSYFGLKSQRGYLFEDAFADCVLEMEFRDFAHLSADFFHTAGHKYFLGVDRRWLVNMTMEEQLYFSNSIFEYRSPDETRAMR
jgi:hypothetical protein